MKQFATQLNNSLNQTAVAATHYQLMPVAVVCPPTPKCPSQLTSLTHQSTIAADRDKLLTVCQPTRVVRGVWVD